MDIYEKIRSILEKHVGINNAITSGEIEKLVELAEDDDTHVKIRGLIFETAKRYSLKLGSNPAYGYYIITNRAEYDDTIKGLSSRINGINERIQIITDNCSDIINGDKSE